MEIKSASRTDVGRVRAINQDSLVVDKGLGLYIVADGMGGHNAGEVASSIACEVIRREIRDARAVREWPLIGEKSSDIRALRKTVETAIQAAGREIFHKAVLNPDQAGMGTTLTMVLLAGQQKGILGHVGDSRLYLLRNASLRQLSEDHTLVNELAKSGAITKAQARDLPQGNLLSRALGVQPSVAVDTMIFDLDPGDTLLICSDGLHYYFPESREIAHSLDEMDLETGLNLLIDTALARGGRDNLTAVSIRLCGATSADIVAIDQRIGILKRIPIFKHLRYNELVKVVGMTQLARISAGKTFITEGEPGDELYVILNGEVDVSKAGDALTTLGSGSQLGEMAMIDKALRSATATARTDTDLLVVRRDDFLGLIRTEPAIATKLLWSFVQVLSNRLRNTNEARQGSRQKLAVREESPVEVFSDDDEG